MSFSDISANIDGQEEIVVNANAGLSPGDVLGGRYRILSLLGQGGTSRVHLAQDMKLQGKLWAVKEIRIAADSGLSAEEKRIWMEALRDEAELLGRLDHPALPRIADYFVETAPAGGELYYMVMDYIEGETLERRFERLGTRMEAMEAAALAVQLCHLFDYLHTSQAEPIIYRDLKPSNLMLDSADRIRLIDFGIARRYKPGRETDTVCVGTVGFAAPEQLAGRQSDPRSDLYAIGALLFYLLSGGRYYEPTLGMGELERKLPREFAAFLARLLAADPAARWSSAREAGAAVLHWLDKQQRGAAAPAAERQAARGPRPLVVAVCGLYPGAGSTFAALALARLLHERGVAHALVEPPSDSAELFALLFGDRHAPMGYRCYNEAMSPAAIAPMLWTDGPALWLPAKPGTIASEAAAEGWSERLQAAIRRPLWIVDAGARCGDPLVQEWMEMADELIYVVDPFLHKLELPGAKRQLSAIRRFASAGKPVHLWANRCMKGSQQAWLRVLPGKPDCLVPAIDLRLAANAVWEGKLPHDDPPIRKALASAVGPWLEGRLRLWQTRLVQYRMPGEAAV